MIFRATAGLCLSFAAIAISGRAFAETPGPIHFGPSFEIFIDRDEPFVHAGTVQGLKVGGHVLVVAGPMSEETRERSEVGTATVMEVWDTLARIHLDDASHAAPDPKFVRLSPQRPSLRVRVELSKRPFMRRVTFTNEGEQLLTHCEIRLSDNRHYHLKRVEPKDHESIMLFRFDQDGEERDVPLDQATVTCAQGETTVPL